jgi:hypothetical protein
MTRLEEVPGISIARMGGQLEAPLYLNEINFEKSAAARAGRAGMCNGHKFAAYIYSSSAIRRILQHIGQVQFIVCVRDPLRALVSWHQMHRDIALSNRLPGHFVHASETSRRFFSEATLEDYYREWVGNRLCYAEHLQRLQTLIGDSPLIVIDQACLAREPHRVIGAVVNQLGLSAPMVDNSPAPPHVGKADRMTLPQDGSPLQADMAREREALHAALDSLSLRPRTLVLR